MDMKLSPEDEAFRSRVREFLDSKLSPEMREEAARVCGVTAERPLAYRWLQILHAQGWDVPSWPVELGGTGWDATQLYIFAAEMALAGAPIINASGTGMAAPTIIAFGTEAQKAENLPRTRTGEYWWCQGYSEPGAGSDLAALKTRAERDGDHYIINGSKIWTTHAHWANRIFCLVRSESGGRPQQGISFLVFDLDLPGITIRPIISLAGEHELNEVFFDDVKVPASALIGEENKGWNIAKYLLTHERLLSLAPILRWRYRRLTEWVSKLDENGERLIDDAAFAEKLARAGIMLDALEVLELRLLMRIRAGDMVGSESSQSKVDGSELRQYLTELAIEAAGYYATPMQPTSTHLPHADEPVGPLAGLTAMGQYLNDRAATIYAGANEVQRNIMAKHVLGL